MKNIGNVIGSRAGLGLLAAMAIVLLAQPVFCAEVVSPREPFFGMEKVQLRIEYKEITLVAGRIHNMFSRQGWYRIEPGQSLIELCDSEKRLDAIQALVERLDAAPRNVMFEVSLMNYAGGEAPAAASESEKRVGPKLTALNRRMAVRKQSSREEEVGRNSQLVPEGQFVEIPLSQDYNIEFQVGYFDRKKELIDINRLVFSRSRGSGKSGGQQGTVILSTDLQLGNGVKHLLTMRKPGCHEYYTLSIRATLKNDPPSRREPARDAGELPVREWP